MRPNSISNRAGEAKNRQPGEMGTKARMTDAFRAEMKARRERLDANSAFLREDLEIVERARTLQKERRERERMVARGETYGPPNPYKPHRRRG